MLIDCVQEEGCGFGTYLSGSLLLVLAPAPEGWDKDYRDQHQLHNSPQHTLISTLHYSRGALGFSH